MPDVMVEQTALAGMTDILLLFYAMDGRTFQYIHDLKKVMPMQVSVLQRIRVGGSIFIFRMIFPFLVVTTVLICFPLSLFCYSLPLPAPFLKKEPRRVCKIL